MHLCSDCNRRTRNSQMMMMMIMRHYGIVECRHYDKRCASFPFGYRLVWLTVRFSRTMRLWSLSGNRHIVSEIAKADSSETFIITLVLVFLPVNRVANSKKVSCFIFKVAISPLHSMHWHCYEMQGLLCRDAGFGEQAIANDAEYKMGGTWTRCTAICYSKCSMGWWSVIQWSVWVYNDRRKCDRINRRFGWQYFERVFLKMRTHLDLVTREIKLYLFWNMITNVQANSEFV